MKDNYKNAFAVIADLWPNFKQPETVIGIGIWDRALAQHDERIIMAAIERLYHKEHFFSFGKLMDILGDMTKPQLMPKADVIATIKRLAANSRQDISNQPEIVQQTIRHAGGLPKLGQKEMNDWWFKDVEKAYDTAAEAMSKPGYIGLDAPDIVKQLEQR